MEALFILAVCVALVLLMGAFIWVADKVACAHYTKREAKRKAEHPQLYALFNQVDTKSTESVRWYNKEIAPRKREIDAILKEWDYYTADTKRKKEQELEELREAIELAGVTRKILDDELQGLRMQVREYIDRNNVKWAKEWGW
jgi:hypothetical protein